MAQTTTGDSAAAGVTTRSELQEQAPLDELRAEVAHLRAQLLRAEEEAALVPGLRAELEAAQGPVRQQMTPEQRMVRAEQTVANMDSSLSWRVTKPLRWFKQRLGR
jgi:hypothetical protein